MLKAIAFGLATGAGVQAWRQWPADGPVTMRAGVLIAIVGLIAAYGAGAWRGRSRGNTAAFAAAHAEANAAAISQQQQTVNVLLVDREHVAASRAGTVRIPDESVEWIGTPRAQISGDDLDGLAVAELLEQGELET